MANSRLSRTDRLTVVPCVIDGDLRNPNVDFPNCLEELIVSGNEQLPSGGTNNWNKSKAKASLKFYGEDIGTDTENENSGLRLASRIGVNQAQLNFAQLPL